MGLLCISLFVHCYAFVNIKEWAKLLSYILNHFCVRAFSHAYFTNAAFLNTAKKVNLHSFVLH